MIGTQIEQNIGFAKTGLMLKNQFNQLSSNEEKDALVLKFSTLFINISKFIHRTMKENPQISLAGLQGVCFKNKKNLNIPEDFGMTELDQIVSDAYQEYQEIGSMNLAEIKIALEEKIAELNRTEPSNWAYLTLLLDLIYITRYMARPLSVRSMHYRLGCMCYQRNFGYSIYYHCLA